MSEALTVTTMTVFEAQEIVKKINSNLQSTRALLLDLYERKGWEALGYESWRACVVGEFKQNERYLYYQLVAAKTERNLCTIVQKDTPIPEGTLRPLTKLPPEEQREVYRQAVETAPEGKVTAKHIEKIVNAKRHPPIHFETFKIGITFKSAYDRLVEEIIRENLNGWKQTDRKGAIHYLSGLVAIIKTK